MPTGAISTRSRSGAKTTCVVELLYAGNNLDKARRIFERAIKHRPRIRLTIRQRTRVLQQWPQEIRPEQPMWNILHGSRSLNAPAALLAGTFVLAAPAELWETPGAAVCQTLAFAGTNAFRSGHVRPRLLAARLFQLTPQNIRPE